jgi:cytochrome c oxidase cbb3-type subunit 3
MSATDGSHGAGERDQTPPPIHVYDDIEEQDNRLPTWWLGILYGSMVFAFGYWVVYEVTHWMPSAAQVHRAQSEEAARRAAAAPLSDNALAQMAADPRVIDEAKKVFGQVCAACHGANAQGLVGPNLTDRFWLHGSTPTAIHQSINGGFPAQGMPPWGKMLGPARVRSLAAYVVTLKGRNLPGKPPQGQEEK